MGGNIKVRPVTDEEIWEHRDVVWFISATSLEESVRYWPTRMSDEAKSSTGEEPSE